MSTKRIFVFLPLFMEQNWQQKNISLPEEDGQGDRFGQSFVLSAAGERVRPFTVK